MKKWEDEQRKKAHMRRVIEAKPTLKTQAQRTPQGIINSTTEEQPEDYKQLGQNRMQVNPSSSAFARGAPFNSGYTNTTKNSSGPRSVSGGQTYQTAADYHEDSPGSTRQIQGGSGQRKRNSNMTSAAALATLGDRELTELPIYQLLRAFNLQQYTRKLTESGYGDEVYKLAVLSGVQRDNLIVQLKPMPGHKAKLSAFFTVIDEIYPRQMVIDQIKSVTPDSKVQLSKKRVTSATRRSGLAAQNLQIQVGPQKTLLQKYEQLDQKTKMQFNQHFLQTLENATRGHQSLSHFIQAQSGISEAAAPEVFPPQYYSYGQDVIDQMNETDVANDVEIALKRFAQKPSYKPQLKQTQTLAKQQQQSQQQQKTKLQKELVASKVQIDKINKEVDANLKKEKERNLIQNQKMKLAVRSQPERPATIQIDESLPDHLLQTSNEQTSYNDQSNDYLLEESQNLYEDFDLLQDKVALANQLKVQYQNVKTDKNKPVQPDKASEGNVEPESDYTDSIININQIESEQSQGVIWQDLNTASNQQAKAKPINLQLKNVIMPNQKQVQPISASRPWSSLLDKADRDKAWNEGHSMDSKKVTEALGFLDMKQICYCLAHALMKHIEFGQGFYFLMDLQQYIKQTNSVISADSKISDVPKNEQLEFTYNLGELKIELPSEEKNLKGQKKTGDDNKAFQELKQRIEEQKTPLQDLKSKQNQISNDLKPEDEFDYGNEIKDESNDQQDFEIYGEEDVTQEKAVDEDDRIQDYYEDDENGPIVARNNGTQLESDLDYSQTHLDDFLKSHTKNLKNTHLQSGQLLSSFVSTVNRMTKGVQPTVPSNFQAIKEDRESIASEQRVNDSDSDEDMGRSGEQINLDLVSAVSSSTKARKWKAIEASMESQEQIKLNIASQQGVREALEFQMRIFDYQYDFELDEVGGNSQFEPSISNPSLEEIYYYCKYVIITGRMEKEIPILCLIYLERFTKKTGILLNYSNWKRLTLISLILASKIWDDDSLENVHFPQVMTDITLKEISGLEQVFLRLIDFDLVIRGAEYAKFYFILKTFSKNFNSVLPMGPLRVEQMQELQNNTVKAESALRDKYNMRLKLQKTM